MEPDSFSHSALRAFESNRGKVLDSQGSQIELFGCLVKGLAMSPMKGGTVPLSFRSCGKLASAYHANEHDCQFVSSNYVAVCNELTGTKFGSSRLLGLWWEIQEAIRGADLLKPRNLGIKEISISETYQIYLDGFLTIFWIPHKLYGLSDRGSAP